MKTQLCLFVCSLTMLSCTKENHQHEQPVHSYAYVLNMSHSESKAWFIQQTPNIQAAVWKYKIQELLKLEWNAKQEQMLLKLEQHIGKSLFSDTERTFSLDYERRWLEKASNQFSEHDLFFMFGTLTSFDHQSNSFAAFKTNEANPNGNGQVPTMWGECECSAVSDYCGWPIGSSTCNLNVDCLQSSRG